MIISPEEAARALHEVHRTQRTALRSAPPMFPAWYLSAVWGSVAAIQFATEVLPVPARPIGLVVVLLGLGVAVGKFIRDVLRLTVRPHRSVIDPWAWIGFAAWIVGTQAACFGLMFVLSAVGFDHPRTAAASAVFVVVLFTGPLLPRWMSMRNALRADRMTARTAGMETAAQ